MLSNLPGLQNSVESKLSFYPTSNLEIIAVSFKVIYCTYCIHVQCTLYSTVGMTNELCRLPILSFRMMSHSNIRLIRELCRIKDYIVRDYVAFDIRTPSVFSRTGLCPIRDYIVRDYVAFDILQYMVISYASMSLGILLDCQCINYYYTAYMQAGHATTLPRQRDHIFNFKPQSCWLFTI